MDALIVQLLTWAIGSHPAALAIITIIGIVRIINKPLFTFLHVVAGITPYDGDDKALDAIEKSKVYGIFSYILDWFGSIKLPIRKSADAIKTLP